MQPQSSSPDACPTIYPEDVKQIMVAGREVTIFGINVSYCYKPTDLLDLDRVWMREADVLAECPSSVINRFLRQNHQWQNVPESVWLNGRAIKPIPLMVAVDFWSQRASAGCDHWARLVVRDLERLEELVYNVFNGIELPEEKVWRIAYRDFDGTVTTLSNDAHSLTPTMYRPTAV